ncbi:DinB family protein [Paenibacillus segetis]|uniref:DinB-like domain-containing protein n=1 Tax=Paenibacillus segetis TaxID=1325360 RepID=A0ABQ1YF82_9BACL|nr:DinB family protein [Paenibacillus segetis]GGH22440.1 hypothetical protein GCM10008013_20890 [Paenibacillus segetis]
MEEKAQLLQQFHNWVNFVHMLEDRETALWNTPIAEEKWAVRDVVSHIMHWDMYFLNEAIVKIAHNQPVTSKHLDYDEFNEQACELGRKISLTKLAEQTIEVRKQIIEHITSMTEEQYDGIYMDEDGNNFGIVAFLQDFIEHDQHHMKQIMNLLKQLT